MRLRAVRVAHDAIFIIMLSAKLAVAEMASTAFRHAPDADRPRRAELHKYVAISRRLPPPFFSGRGERVIGTKSLAFPSGAAASLASACAERRASSLRPRPFLLRPRTRTFCQETAGASDGNKTSRRFPQTSSPSPDLIVETAYLAADGACRVSYPRVETCSAIAGSA